MFINRVLVKTPKYQNGEKIKNLKSYKIQNSILNSIFWSFNKYSKIINVYNCQLLYNYPLN